MDRIRLENRKPSFIANIDEGVWDWLPDPTTTTEEARWRTLSFALADLPFQQSQAIELAFYQGLSQSQISEHLNIPLGTVKTRVRLGIEKLREALLAHHLEDSDRSEFNNNDVKYDERYR